MFIKHLKLENFRNLKNVDIDFGDINILTGKNSSGKTNLLHALANCLNTSSNLQQYLGSKNVTIAKGLNHMKIEATLGYTHKRLLILQMKSGQEMLYELDEMSFSNSLDTYTLSDKQTIMAHGYRQIIPKDLFKGTTKLSSFLVNVSKNPLNKFDEVFTQDLEYERKISLLLDNKLLDSNISQGRESKTEYKEDHQYWINQVKQQHSLIISSHIKNNYNSNSSASIYNYITDPLNISDNNNFDEAYKLIKSTKKGFQGFLPFENSNFLSLIADIQRDRDIKKTFNQDLLLYTDNIIKDIHVITSGTQGKKGSLYIDSTNIPGDKLEKISAGTAVIIYFITLKNWLSLKRMKYTKPHILLLDEVDCAIHPTLLGKLVELLKIISKRMQIFITTHSPRFIDYFDKKDIYRIKDYTSFPGKITNKTKNILSYQDIINRSKENNIKNFLETKNNSELFIDGLIDNIFPYEMG